MGDALQGIISIIIILHVVNMSYNITMKMANIAVFKNNLSYFISIVEKGEEIEVCKRNIPVAKVLPVNRVHENKTKLGCGRGTVPFTKADLTEPFIPERSSLNLSSDTSCGMIGIPIQSAYSRRASGFFSSTADFLSFF